MNNSGPREEIRAREQKPGNIPRWIVRRSRFPLALPGELLGTVDAHTRTEALLLAVRFGPAITVEPYHTTDTTKLERAVRSAERRNRGARYGHGRARRHPRRGGEE